MLEEQVGAKGHHGAKDGANRSPLGRERRASINTWLDGEIVPFSHSVSVPCFWLRQKLQPCTSVAVAEGFAHEAILQAKV